MKELSISSVLQFLTNDHHVLLYDNEKVEVENDFIDEMRVFKSLNDLKGESFAKFVRLQN